LDFQLRLIENKEQNEKSRVYADTLNQLQTFSRSLSKQVLKKHSRIFERINISLGGHLGRIEKFFINKRDLKFAKGPVLNCLKYPQIYRRKRELKKYQKFL
jgi:hypothetical protein